MKKTALFLMSGPTTSGSALTVASLTAPPVPAAERQVGFEETGH